MSRYYEQAREIFERARDDGIVVMQRVALKRAIQRESAWAYRAPREELVEEARELRVYRSRVDSDYRIA